MQQKAFLRSFIRGIGIKGDQAEVEYTCPMALLGDGRREVLSLDRNGSPGLTIKRTFKIMVSLGASGRRKPYKATIAVHAP